MRRQIMAWTLAVFACSGGAARPPLQRISVEVGGVQRGALVYAPEAAVRMKTPVVLAFHGSGGSAKQAADLFQFETHWPEAIVVYMQGLPIISVTDPGREKSGWQYNPGETGDRDLKFFDTVLARLKQNYQVDERRVYATGHSNGGGFTYLLWATRGDRLAAVAPSSATSGNRYLEQLKPKPALHVAGENDPFVSFTIQRELTEAVRKRNGCEDQGKPWAGRGILYPSAGGTPFVAVFHPGGHELLEAAPRLIVRFFKEQVKQ